MRFAASLFTVFLLEGAHAGAPPSPEPIKLTTLPLPPVIANTSTGSCTLEFNSHGTGCTGRQSGLQVGSWMPDGKHVLAHINFIGAPAAPAAASIYIGQQVIIIKSDGTLFPNGDSWKCITCGVDPSHAVGASGTSLDWSYPQAFSDGKRILAGTYIIDGGADLTGEGCTPATTYVYPIRLNAKADGSGNGQFIRELRLHPDGVHIGINALGLSPARSLSEVGYYGRLNFNPAPMTGLPLVPRYDVINVSLLLDNSGSSPLFAKGNELFFNHSSITVGELRGFSGSGDELTYIGYPVESCNIDVSSVDLLTGRVRRLTSHPGYTDPIEFSPDDQWFVVQDTRGSGRVEFMDGLRWLPPVADQITATACSSVRNNGIRRFFQPYLIDRYGDRGTYYGQSLNHADKGVAGSGDYDDPEWNGQADPWFSPDGTKIVYWQAKAIPPACGGRNPLPCYNSTEPGGRTERIIVAHLTSRKPLKARKIKQGPEVIPWAIPYVAGEPTPNRPYPREGQYTLKGRVSGYADVTITENAAKNGILSTAVELHGYSDDGRGCIDGFQNITVVVEGITLNHLDWYSDLTRTDYQTAEQYTSADGFHMSIDATSNIFSANGTLITTTDGVVYRQPLNGA
ncbi:uncharacterized protein K489DRAFT_390413 [Dissoconium aciculare CBS 342.82]|uniref:Saponin hydrolase n=1 Tax=Dissoconium aciculare CBS 342.82 TaxID=1314786 RepID=A0A6J3LVB9_9PEZI|nr:uncharacterized protein K489DRAFT_390413 [Dissoconium aciculare CBS 342.82]KAF1819710.1 hypothetical protein K489DRAFT_390413 [Dissoconium aciculare CBS 342.82]